MIKNTQSQWQKTVKQLNFEVEQRVIIVNRGDFANLKKNQRNSVINHMQ